MAFKAAVKQALTSLLKHLTGRPAVFLAPEAVGGLLPVAAPYHATLREWYAADARFRQLLAERNLGDLILLLARREAA